MKSYFIKYKYYIIGLLLFIYLNKVYVFMPSAAGQYVNTNYEYGQVPEIPYFQDTLVLGYDYSAVSGHYGKGHYYIKHKFLSTKIYLVFESITFVQTIERRMFSPVIWLDREYDHYYKMDWW